MCGIVAIWVKNKSKISELNHLESAILKVQHRGPDNIGIKKYAKVGLAHARLSIIDLSSAANQPFYDENNNYSLVFNGEIYNHNSLRTQLIKLGYTFKTNSDTEVLLNLLIEFGEDAIEMLNGFFAFAFYDIKNDQLIYAKDRFGIKPLYIFENDNVLIISSEIKSIQAFEVDLNLNLESVSLLFGLTYIPTPFSIYKEVRSLIPGTFGIVKNDKSYEKYYYKIIDNKEIKVSFENAKLKVKSLLEDAVKLRVESDVPLGAFLSGGVDSSIVSLLAKRFKSDLKTFSIGFDVDFFDESKFAKILANNIQSNHKSELLKQSDFSNNFESFLNSLDEPFGDSSAFAMYLLSKKAKKELTVCLSGDGADELFGGYRKYAAEWQIRNMRMTKRRMISISAFLLKNFPENRGGRWSDLNRKIQKINKGFQLNYSERYWSWANFISENERNQLLVQSIDSEFSSTFKIDDNLNSVFISDQKMVLPSDMLTKVDRMSMQSGLEVRTPFLDHNLVDYVNSLPASYKVNNGIRKHILIEAFRNDLPAEIINRQKKGFEIPIKNWLNESIGEILKSDLFSKKYIKSQGIFKYDYICSLHEKWKDKRFGDSIYLVWTLIVFQYWWDKNVRKRREEN